MYNYFEELSAFDNSQLYTGQVIMIMIINDYNIVH